MNSAPLVDYIVAALNAGSVALLLCGACIVLGCQFLGVVRHRRNSERIEERNNSKEGI